MGLLTHNATWCQNRGCICISSARRTYGRIHSSFLHPAYIRTIILWTELFPKKRREKIQGEILQSIFEYRVQWCFHIPTRTTVFPHAIQQLQVILHTELILPQEILQLQGSSHAGSFQQLFPVSPSILHGRTRLPASLQHSKAIQHKQGNKLLSIIELWTRSKQGDKPLNLWLTQIYNLVNICKYPEDSTDRIIRDNLIVGCNSNHARDKIIRQGEAVTLNQVIEILQTEESTHSTMQQIQGYDKKSTGSIYYQAYDSRSKKSKVSNEQNSSSSPTGSKKKCFRCGELFSRQHMKECRAQDVICNGCGIKGHLKKCCKKSGNFPKDNSNRQNQSPSTGPGKMNIASALLQTEADFFDEKGLPKQYIPQNQQQHTGSMYVLKKFQGKPNDDILFSDNGVEIQHSASGPDPAPIPTPDFPFQEFLLMEVVKQSQIDISSISDTSDLRENSNSSRKATKSTDLPLQSGLANRSHEEMTEYRDLTVSDKHSQSSRDSNTISISDNSTTRESNPGIITRITTGIMTDTPTTLPVETDITTIHSNNHRSVIPTDTQALTVLQDLISDDFQVKNTPSTQRKREDTRSIQRKGEDETFQLIQKIHNQLQQVQWDLQRLHSLHKYKN